MDHPWPRSPRRAILLQTRLRGRLRIGGRLGVIRHVAGADIAYDPGRRLSFAAVLVFRFPALELVEFRAVRSRIRFPYIPGLLSFREAPAIVQAARRLEIRPDLLICDGQGIAHPRGIGLASHLGLLLDLPTIGCAKSRLVGEHGPVGPRRGDRVPLRVAGRRVGSVLRTRAGVRPLYVSPGHLIGHSDSIRLVLACTRGFRLPEPVRQADRFVAAFKSDPAARPDGPERAPGRPLRAPRFAVIESPRRGGHDGQPRHR